jgi:pilus assembly protein CpaC
MRLSTVLFLVIMTVMALVLAAAPAAAEDAGARRHISIEQHKGRLLRFDAPVKTVFIANPDIADVQTKSPRVIYVTAKKPGETTLIAVDENDNLLVNIGITVNHNLSRLKRTLDDIMPGNRIQVRSVDGAVVLVGEVDTPLEASQAVDVALRFVEKKEQIVNGIAVKGPNIVNLRVRIVEMQREVTRQIGINWEPIYRAGAFTFGLATGSAAPFILQSVTTAGTVTQSAVFNTRRQLTNASVNNFFARYNRGNYDLTAMVDLLEQDGLVKTLAQPNLSTMSGKSAHFLAGGEFPVPVAQQDGVITIEFKRFGVSLSFTPVILSGNRISMRVAPEVSQLSSNGAITLNSISIPALTTRKADTMIEVGSGQSFAIGGLLQNNVTRAANKVPWLADIPVLGKLFTSERYIRNETELVILVTPYIVGALKEISPDPRAHDPRQPEKTENPPAKSPAAAKTNAKAPAPKGPGGFQLD